MSSQRVNSQRRLTQITANSAKECDVKILKILLSTLILSILATCGGGSSSSNTGGGGISGTATKGPVSNATVTAYAINNGQMGLPIASTTTDVNGNFTMTMGGYAGPVMLQMSGGSYTDEATGTTNMPMAAGDVMTAVMPTVAAGAAVSGVQVTPITSMAQVMTQHMTGGMTDANIATANTAMGNYFMIGDILHTLPMNPLVTGSGTGVSQDAQNYGMALAAISQSALTQGMTSSSAMVTALMNDASDGVMDGMMAGSHVMMGGMTASTALPATAGTSGLGGAMNTFLINTILNKSGLTSTSPSMVALMSKLNTAGTSAPIMTNPPVMLNATVSGTAFNGLMSKATVKAYAINNGATGAQIASVATDGQGNFTLPLGSYTGPVMLQMSGGTYTDEATGTPMLMAASDVMSAVLPTVTSGASVTGIKVTPVTSMAQTRALAMSGGMTDANIATANTAMGNYFSVSDILHTPPMNPLVPGSGTTVGITQDMKNYGLAIAAMSQSANTLGMTVSSAFVTAMMSDASDGLMDGKMGTSPISMSMGGMMGGTGMMAQTAGTSSLATAMTTFMNSTANASGLTALDMNALITKVSTSIGQI